MPFVHLEEHLPGITGLLEYSPLTAKPIRELTQILLRGPSTLTPGERELIAAIVSSLFRLYNRYVDGLSAVTPTNPVSYENLAKRIATGYDRLPQGYDHLRNQPI